MLVNEIRCLRGCPKPVEGSRGLGPDIVTMAGSTSMTGPATSTIDEAPSLHPITDTYDYDAFGNKVNSTGSTPNNYLYRGEQFDSDLGLYYLCARYYNPITGRFMSRDPHQGSTFNPAGLHKYLYADGDPIDGQDPSGRMDTTVGDFPIPDSPGVPKPDYGPLRPQGAVEYGLVVGAVSLGAVAGVREFAEAVECSYEKLASNVNVLTQKMSLAAATNSLIPSGSCRGPDCGKKLEEIYKFMNEIAEKIDEMLIDKCDLYNQAYDVKNPSLPGACGRTTWVGHEVQIQNLQRGLRRLLKEAEEMGCPIPPGAWPLATRPTPNQPRGN